MGEQSDEAGTAALKALKRAVDDHAKGLFDVLVTAPVNPSSIKNNAFPFTSQTDYLERTAGNGQKALTILVNEHLRVAMATRPLPVKDIAGSITKETVVEKARVLFNALKRDFIITNPRIAILALNPCNTKEAPAGKEEQEIIIPAIADLEAKGIQAFGPTLPTPSSVTECMKRSTVCWLCTMIRDLLRSEPSIWAKEYAIPLVCPLSGQVLQPITTSLWQERV